MGTIKPYQRTGKNGPSTFAMLVDNINKMSESEQKLLWIQINKEKLSTLAKEIDISVTQNNFSEGQIDEMIKEARNNGKGRKKS